MPIKLIALDLDGTLFNHDGKITEETKKEIKRATDLGIHVVISTGRPYNGVPFAQIEGLGIHYAITTNGSAIYSIPEHKCIYEDCMDFEMVEPILKVLLEKRIHIDTYINGEGFTPVYCRENIDRLHITPSLKEYILKTRTPTEDLIGYVKDCRQKIQKITLNFYPQPDGTLEHRDEIYNFLCQNPSIECVCGGFQNLEFTKAGVTKGKALQHLAFLLSIPIEETMAVGDTENDLSILEAAGIGVAMGNAPFDIKSAADFITASNEEDGVGKAIAHFIP